MVESCFRSVLPESTIGQLKTLTVTLFSVGGWMGMIRNSYESLVDGIKECQNVSSMQTDFTFYRLSKDNNVINEEKGHGIKSQVITSLIFT